MKKVFITGVTGLLGTNVLLKLLENDYFVIALVRKINNYTGDQHQNLKLIEGDLFADYSEYLKDVNFVIHIAAETRQNLINYEAYRKVNFESTVNLFSQCNAVEKFIFISTANTIGFGNLDELGNEKAKQKFPFTNSFYAKSKLEAENYLLQNNSETEVIILNPTFMIGAHDHKPSSGKIIFWCWKRQLVFYPKGGKNFVHVEDVANGILNAMEKGKNGEKYLLSGENLKYKSFFQKLNLVVNQNPIMLPIPNQILFLLGITGDILRFFKIKTGLSSINMKALRIDNFYSNKKSVEEFGMTYFPTEKAIFDAVEFFKDKHRL